MSWIKMAFKYEGKCMVCNQMIKKNEMGFWSKGIGVKHENVQKKMKILSALFVVVQSGVQLVNLLKIVILKLYRHYAYVKNVSN